MEIMWACCIHAELWVSTGKEGFLVFVIFRGNSVRSNLAHSHQHQTRVRSLRSLSSMAQVGSRELFCWDENMFK